MTEKERINKDLHRALDQLPEIMIGLQQMLKIVNEHELDYQRMDDYTPLNRVTDLINIAHGNTSKGSIDHLVGSYTVEDQEDDDYPDYDKIEELLMETVTQIGD